MNVMVTGGAGFIGSHFVYDLVDAGYKNIVIVDDMSTGHDRLIHADTIFYKEKIGNIEKIKEILIKHKIDIVVNFAGSIIVSESVVNPLKYYDNNTAQTLALLIAMQEAGVNKFIFSSTAAVYGENNDLKPLDENVSLSPINPYGQSKLMIELMLKDLSFANPKFNYVALRYFNACGADTLGRTGQICKDATHLIKVATETALGKREKMSVFGTDYPTHDGTAVRDYIHVSDLATIHRKMIDYLNGGGKSDVFNCGYSRGNSVLDVIRSVEKANKSKLNYVLADRRAGDPASLVADNSKLLKTIDFTPKYADIDIMTKSALDWEKGLL